MTPTETTLRAHGLTVESVAQATRLTPRYLRHLLRHGAPYGTALRLAKATGLQVEYFSNPRSGSVPGTQGRGAAAGRGRRTPVEVIQR